MKDATSTLDVMEDLKTIQALRNEQFDNDEEIFNLSLENLKLQNEMDIFPETKPKEKIQRLRDEKAANEEKIAQLQERQHYCKMQLKICEKKMKEYERKQRNRRIFTRGRMLEAFLIEPLLLTDDDVYDFLQTVFRMPEVDSLLQELIDRALTLEDDESENVTETGGD